MLVYVSSTQRNAEGTKKEKNQVVGIQQRSELKLLCLTEKSQ